MVWLLQRNDDVLMCEIRQPIGSTEYEFAVAAATGPAETIRFSTPEELIRGYLQRQTALQALGWRPRPVPAEPSRCS
jgi:hypothetical protein